VTDRARWAEAYLKYRFSDPSLLELALTHRSASGKNNERLEFLGDAFLSASIAAELYVLRPEYSEGELSRARAALVNRRALASVARELEIDSQIILGKGEMRAGAANRGSMLADALEAVIGAVLLDGQHEAAEALVLRLFGERLQNLPAASALKDAKTQLQEWLQAQGLGLPVYRVDTVTGKDHARTFVVSCELAAGYGKTTGQGPSRRRAEQEAAAAMLSKVTGE
jgi:ribonuclease-3